MSFVVVHLRLYLPNFKTCFFFSMFWYVKPYNSKECPFFFTCKWFPVFPGSAIWKAFFFTPDFYPQNSSACFHTHICFCIKPFITFHDPPLLYDLSRDPSESTPLSPDTEPQFYSVLKVIRAAVSRHTLSLKPVPIQLSPLQIVWKPWLQPCCSSLSQLCRCEQDHQIEKLRH